MRKTQPRRPPPLDDRDIEHLQTLLDAVPAPLAPLDVSMLDGYLCGVLLQPQTLPEARWLPLVADTEGRRLPGSYDAEPLWRLVRRRHAELDAAIARRQWFDPWVFELAPDPGSAIDVAAASEGVYPWVVGFALAMEHFPGLMALPSTPALLEPLALLYRHLGADDVEDADDLLALIDELEPPADLAQAVEELVRATLLLADLSRPRASGPR